MNKIKNIIFDLNGVIFEYVISPEGSHLIKPIKEGVLLLKKCSSMLDVKKNGSYSLFSCTNWNKNIIELLFKNYPEIMELFHDVITPDHAGAKKPNQVIFDYLVKKYDLNSSECIFIDDQYDNVLAAKSYGMVGHHLKNFEILEKELKNLGIFK